MFEGFVACGKEWKGRWGGGWSATSLILQIVEIELQIVEIEVVQNMQ